MKGSHKRARPEERVDAGDPLLPTTEPMQPSSRDAVDEPLVALLPNSTIVKSVASLEASLKTPPSSDKLCMRSHTRVFFFVPVSNRCSWRNIQEDAAEEITQTEFLTEHFIIDTAVIPFSCAMEVFQQFRHPHAAISLPATPPASVCAHVFRFATVWVHHAEKAAVEKAVDLTSLLRLEPVHSVCHLYERLLMARDRGSTFLIAYSGATWCPPCCRIMPRLSALINEVNSLGHPGGGLFAELVKIDRDAAASIDVVYGVELIPFFQVFRVADINQLSSEELASLAGLPPVRPPAMSDEEWDSRVNSARAVAPRPIASLQDSNPTTVAAFFERWCVPFTLTDEGF